MRISEKSLKVEISLAEQPFSLLLMIGRPLVCSNLLPYSCRSSVEKCIVYMQGRSADPEISGRGDEPEDQGTQSDASVNGGSRSFILRGKILEFLYVNHCIFG